MRQNAAKHVHLQNPELPIFPFDVYELDSRVRYRHFPEIESEAAIVIADRKTLAGTYLHESRRVINLHPILNAEWTPIEVIEHILIHEYLRHRIPVREVEPGVLKSHPPEFWQAERQLSPLRGPVWYWLEMSWVGTLRRDVKAECVWVKRCWRREREAQRSRIAEGSSPCNFAALRDRYAAEILAHGSAEINPMA